MSTIYVAGVSMTHFGKHLERSIKDSTAEALNGVLAGLVLLPCAATVSADPAAAAAKPLYWAGSY